MRQVCDNGFDDVIQGMGGPCRGGFHTLRSIIRNIYPKLRRTKELLTDPCRLLLRKNERTRFPEECASFSKSPGYPASIWKRNVFV